VNDRVAIASVRRLGGASTRTDQDLVAVEAPLSLTVSHPAIASDRALGVLMRTPGDDEHLVLGLLHAEGVVRTLSDVVSIDPRVPPDRTSAISDQVHVVLAATVDAGVLPGGRPLPATSACGLCGRLSLDTLDLRRGPHDDARFSAELLASLPGRLRSGQAVFAETGGLHAAAVFDTAGECRALSEDVGRHNAVDKVVGALLRSGRLPAAGNLLAVSGRVAFEIVQKAAMAGVAAIVAVGAPSSLAIEAARSVGMTLVGFARDGQFNVYAGMERVIFSATADTRPQPPGRHR
jgi:FdhD protein